MDEGRAGRRGFLQTSIGTAAAAMPRAHSFLAMELALRAQADARKVRFEA